MKARFVVLCFLSAMIFTMLLLQSLYGAVHAAPNAPSNLAYTENIYGGPGLETIEYLSDLNFYSWGGFGVNAHVFRSRLQSSGDEIAYAISDSKPDAFVLEVVDQFSTTFQIHVTKSMYSSGTVTQSEPDELHFVWEIEQEDLHLKLHKIATLETDTNIHTERIIREEFAVENLGEPFTLIKFIEYWHMDDRARTWDYDSDGRPETLLAINSFTSSGYPVFGKVYVQRPNLTTALENDGRFASVTHALYSPFATNSWQNISEAVYVSSTALNGMEAERQVAEDAEYLLNIADRLTLEYPSSLLTGSNIDKWINSYFDHEYPTYITAPNNQGIAYQKIIPYWGDRRGAGTAMYCDNGPASSIFCYDGHDGYDLNVAGEIRAAAGGTVLYVGCDDENQNPPTGDLPCSRHRGSERQWMDGLGLMVVISHGDNYETIYGHLSSVTVMKEMNVTAGNVIGNAGNTGNSGGTHLHFGVTHNGKIFDPFGWIPGEVLIDPNTQPIITNVTTGEVYQGEASFCLWVSGCPASQWINPTQLTTISSPDGIGELVVPANTLASITHVSIIPAFDAVANSNSVPTDYSFDIRAWDKAGTPVVDFVTPLEFSIRYSDTVASKVDETTLGFYWWDETQSGWLPVTTALDTDNNIVTATLSHLSWFSLRGVPINPAPQLTQVTPQVLSTETSMEIIIYGTNFSPNAIVLLGKTRLPFSYINSGTIRAIVPAWEPNGVYTVQIVNPDYQSAKLLDVIEIATPFWTYLPIIIR